MDLSRILLAFYVHTVMRRKKCGKCPLLWCWPSLEISSASCDWPLTTTSLLFTPPQFLSRNTASSSSSLRPHRSLSRHYGQNCQKLSIYALSFYSVEPSYKTLYAISFALVFFTKLSTLLNL